MSHKPPEMSLLKKFFMTKSQILQILFKPTKKFFFIRILHLSKKHFMIADQPPDILQNMWYSQKLTAQTIFHLMLLSSLVIPLRLFPPSLPSRLPSSVHSDAILTFLHRVNAYKEVCNISVLLTLTAAKGFFRLGAKLWKGMKINPILFAEGQNFACKSLALN